MNDKRIAPAQRVALKKHDRVAFGRLDFAWEVVSVDPPEPMVTPLGGGEAVTMTNGMIVLPSAENPLATLYPTSREAWVLDDESGSVPIKSSGVFEAGGTAWRFSCPELWQPTVRTQQIRLVQLSTFHFEVSPDEEHVELTVKIGTESVNMGHLSGYYFLLTLARERLRQEAEAGYPGWVHREDLIRMLRCGEQQLNVWVHRIRARFCTSGFVDYADVVQRESGTGRIRIGVAKSVISTIA